MTDSNAKSKAPSLSSPQITQHFASSDHAEGTLVQRSAGLITACERFVEEQTNVLSHLKKEMQGGMNAAVAEAKGSIVDWENLKLGDFAEVVAGKKWRGDDLVLFQYEERGTNCDFSELIGVKLENLNPIPPKSSDFRVNSDNPLQYADVNAYISAISELSENSNPYQLQSDYYKAHLECLNSKEAAYLSAIQDQDIADGLEKWTLRGLEAYQSRLKWPISDLQKRDFAQRLAFAYEIMKETAETMRILEELAGKTALLVPVSLDEPQTTEKKKRGRPPKSSTAGSKDAETVKKRKRGRSHGYLEEKQAVVFAPEIPWEKSGEFSPPFSPRSDQLHSSEQLP